MTIEECIKQVIIECGKDDPEGVELFTKVKSEGMAYSELTNIYGKTVSNLKKIVSEVNTMLKDLSATLFREGEIMATRKINEDALIKKQLKKSIKNLGVADKTPTAQMKSFNEKLKQPNTFFISY